jgi:Integrase core domain.
MEVNGRQWSWWGGTFGGQGMTKEVKQYVEGCDLCQRNKNRTQPPAGKLLPNEVPEKPWTHITADFIVKLPLAQGYDAILVVVDRLTKMAHFVATTEKTSAVGLARLFRDHVWKLHGLPESIISDRGPQFAAGLMKEVNEMLGIQTKLSTAFHPQTDGQTERMNQELEQYLRMFIDHLRNSGLSGWELQSLLTTIRYRHQRRYHHLKQTMDRTPEWVSR